MKAKFLIENLLTATQNKNHIIVKPTLYTYVILNIKITIFTMFLYVFKLFCFVVNYLIKILKLGFVYDFKLEIL